MALFQHVSKLFLGLPRQKQKTFKKPLPLTHQKPWNLGENIMAEKSNSGGTQAK